MKKEIKVRIAEYKVTKGPNRLITMGLGSCVGIGIYDQYVTSFGGLPISCCRIADNLEAKQAGEVC